ncbi:MAG: ABC transporter permease [Clostridiaceae bacterium]
MVFVKQIKTGQLIQDLIITIIKVTKGYFLAIIIGLPLGTMMGISLKAYKYFSIIINMLRQIPDLAWIPLLILIFGLSQTSSIVIIAEASFFPIVLNSINGLKSTPKEYIEVGKLYRINRVNMFMKVYLPSALPSIFVGLRLGLSMAWSMVVVAEMIISSTGIGQTINSARNAMKSDILIFEMILIGITGSIMDFLLRKLSNYFIKM